MSATAAVKEKHPPAEGILNVVIVVVVVVVHLIR
jgi:hypothetical protein